ncbi:hemerythrin HHE cation-binding protein [Komarekiella sp. 'clone 1']|uniref:Hemerythrin HHE cation-binding protein n=1 Tax=Komarekiella delphini-convector SJRDD-AB1 TaxID=2593771 RepID=A0AA40T2X3_9NOST|nr:hemerythrin HHE cation-binding protein [Komarekiella delphini-convector]MBD6619642.1 hemerythrin HHE cation-binding protein [Komarekiella delphini-convector SJRDD-AB1]
MVVALDDTKRSAIATELADLKAIQELLIANEQKVLPVVSNDEEISQRLNDFLKDDQKNLKVIEEVISKFGGGSPQPRDTIRQYVEQVNRLIDGNELTLYQKVSAHERIKHQAVMTGLIIHKASQVVGDDVKEAIGPLNQVNFENRAHQEQLKGVLEVLGTRELTGKDPDQGVWARTQDAVAALRGVFEGLTK